LAAVESGRALSVEHEEAWLILAGFLLRPGFGVTMDERRIDELWRIVRGGLRFPGKRIKLQEYILWRRVAGGLDRVQTLGRGGRCDGSHGARLQIVESDLERSDVHDGLEARRYWDLATSAMRAKVAASRTQISARILRSSATPADFRPLMSVP